MDIKKPCMIKSIPSVFNFLTRATVEILHEVQNDIF